MELHGLPQGLPILRRLWPPLRRTMRAIIVEQGTRYPSWGVLVNEERLSQHFCPFRVVCLAIVPV